ncbi:sugar transferase [Pseudogulbenkiania sp. NH8B]|uniref:sugar transferase n=1 Tax=Pseudogulbenkiania sp. (strain NH8B) TaxID=748280 RepID=UPI000227A5A6|nr:sugar transferase [Pseudogulbenkiania sp. NH8B]BAK78305.1 sugar transferase [Pseudogulbenkiania sp. NH8B]
MTTKKLAPIVLFVFARPNHTHKTLESLRANTLAKESDLIIYADAARNASEAEKVKQVRHLLQSINGFNSIKIIERETNIGLARNIIEGVTDVCERHGKAIVLEDDIVTSPTFLEYMNGALDRYADEKNIWHISGWNYPIEPTGLEDAFFWRAMNCWGWGTWQDRWVNFRKDPRLLIESWSTKDISAFNLDDAYSFWEQVQLNHQKKINTWAIFWYATIFSHKGLCLNPAQTLVLNIGIDGSGENCGTTAIYTSQLSRKSNFSWPREHKESSLALERIKHFYKNNNPSIARRIARKLKRHFRNILKSALQTRKIEQKQGGSNDQI